MKKILLLAALSVAVCLQGGSLERTVKKYERQAAKLVSWNTRAANWRVRRITILRTDALSSSRAQLYAPRKGLSLTPEGLLRNPKDCPVGWKNMSKR